MKPIFQKNLQFRDIWPWHRQKIAQIEVLGHFLDFASLAFLDFAHKDRWAWCLVVFLQFAGLVNVLSFLSLKKLYYVFFLLSFLKMSIKFYMKNICLHLLSYLLGSLMQAIECMNINLNLLDRSFVNKVIKTMFICLANA